MISSITPVVPKHKRGNLTIWPISRPIPSTCAAGFQCTSTTYYPWVSSDFGSILRNICLGVILPISSVDRPRSCISPRKLSSGAESLFSHQSTPVTGRPGVSLYQHDLGRIPKLWNFIAQRSWESR
ncbi:hypothetical protein V565_058980 [Rhizoctonia solani 123E]|uniref:Uncharacterized protein n=1 Tax=Rhizoctonia solani 123E TaxID=1423351 RepID=A0A074S3Y0_9AGAM|nr:hypothetical protein V565_058980 [Rhizoctonia solani 123E]